MLESQGRFWKWNRDDEGGDEEEERMTEKKQWKEGRELSEDNKQLHELVVEMAEVLIL